MRDGSEEEGGYRSKFVKRDHHLVEAGESLLRRRERTQIVSGEDGELEDIVPSADRKVQYHQNDQPKQQQKQVRRKHFCYPIPIHTATISRYAVPKSIFESAQRFNFKIEHRLVR
jgi:hypothetical protein